jgi:hydroxyacylglutathione hydrolase
LIFRQFLHYEPVAASYLLGCAGRQLAAVVDPVGDLAPYLEAAERGGMRIRYVIDTHLHADHFSAGRELAARTGAEYVLHHSVPAPSTLAVADGAQLVAGNVQIDVVHTPGHTPEHISLLITDRSRANDPWMVLTGHTLMVGDMGRTELATDASEGAKALFASARRLSSLDDAVEIWPGAFAGSLCGRGLSGKASSTIGFERRFNRAFRLTDEKEFVDFMLRETAAAPPNAESIRRRNLEAPVR